MHLKLSSAKTAAILSGGDELTNLMNFKLNFGQPDTWNLVLTSNL